MAITHDGRPKASSDALAWRVNESFLPTRVENGLPRIDYQVPSGFANANALNRILATTRR